MADQKLTARRSFRRLRMQFRKSLGLENLTPADRVLIDQAALLALRARDMREAILSGERVISDEDLVRTTNACIRAMAAIDKRKDRDKTDPVADIWAESQDRWLEEQRAKQGGDQA
jgi:hypothetical protein